MGFSGIESGLDHDSLELLWFLQAFVPISLLQFLELLDFLIYLLQVFYLIHYILQVFNTGFGLPNAGFKEYLVSAATKVLSRPVAAALYPYLPEMGRDGLAVLHQLIIRQARASKLKTS